MTTDASKLAPGLAYPLATLLAAQIDGTANADILCRGGFNPTLAVELAHQMNAGVGNVDYLMTLGLNPDLAKAIKSAIDA